VLLGYGSRPGDVDRDGRALAAAKSFFHTAPSDAATQTPGVLY
jgi:hypothetical protein